MNRFIATFVSLLLCLQTHQIIETSIKLGKLFGLSENYFLNLQTDIDIREAKLSLGNSVDKITSLAIR